MRQSSVAAGQEPGLYTRAVEWDVPTWSRAVRAWEDYIALYNPGLGYGLELGSRHGGLSFFFAQRYGSNMVCSDYGGPSEKALALHQSEGLSEKITYSDVDATAMAFSDGTFDFVVFKSMLGAVGSRGRYERMEQAMAEIHRVLKPGGVLFFAENLAASPLHRLLRRMLIPWGRSWTYLSYREMQDYLAVFDQDRLESTGFLAVFASRPAWLKAFLAHVDSKLTFLPASWRYVGYGWGRKGFA